MLSFHVGSVLLATTLASTALAQGAATRDSVVKLPGTTITATRSPASILKTPLAITKVMAPDLRAVSGFGLDEALGKIPGVIAQSRYGPATSAS